MEPETNEQSVNSDHEDFKKIDWLNTTKKVSDLKFHPKNPRVITESDITEMNKSMDEFGYFDPVTVNLDNVIISGHKRIMAMLDKELFEEEIDVRIPTRLLSPEEHEKLMLIANKLGSKNSQWDWDTLNNKFDEALLFDVGFTENELSGATDIDSNIDTSVSSPIQDGEVDPTQGIKVIVTFRDDQMNEADNLHRELSEKGLVVRLKR